MKREENSNWYKMAYMDFKTKALHPQETEVLNKHISPEELKLLDSLEKQLDLALKQQNNPEIDRLSEEISVLEEILSSRVDEVLSEGHSIEGQGGDLSEDASIEELLANLYSQYIGQSPYSKKEIIQQMKSNVEMFGGKAISDEQILDAAKDSYIRKMELIKKHKEV